MLSLININCVFAIFVCALVNLPFLLYVSDLSDYNTTSWLETWYMVRLMLDHYNAMVFAILQVCT